MDCGRDTTSIERSAMGVENSWIENYGDEATDASNCQMLCRMHNRAKGNR